MLGAKAIISRSSLQRLGLRAFPVCYVSRNLSLSGWKKLSSLPLCTERDFLSQTGCAGQAAGMGWGLRVPWGLLFPLGWSCSRSGERGKRKG